MVDVRKAWGPLALWALVGCADKELDATTKAAVGEACDPAIADACAEGLVCEPVAGTDADHVCAGRLEIRGSVIDALDDAAIEGALVVAADELGAPATRVATTDAEGRYALVVSVRRDESGEIAETQRWTLIVSAAGYLPFPGGLRPALPIHVDEAAPAEDDGATLSTIDGASTIVALLPTDREGGVAIRGQVEGEHAAGTLVVAEGPDPAPLAVADLDGAFTLFDVPAGEVTVRGHRAGVELQPAAVTVGDEDVSDVRLTVITDDPSEMAAVTGSVNIVDARGGLATSVVLVPVSVYDEVFERGPVPLGLRAPAPPDAPSISSSFSIAGVPEGRYKVLAAFENDGLVRDPDASIAGTELVEIDVAAGQSVDVAQSFKITEALAVVSPGADGPEEVDGAPTFVWADDSSEDRYELVVRDALGNEVWRDDAIPRVTGGGDVEVPYAGPALVQGMFYQFRVTSWSDGAQGSTALSRTEDLRGVFVVR